MLAGKPCPFQRADVLYAAEEREEMKLVNANKRFIELFDQKVKNKINEVWGVKINSQENKSEELPLAAEEKSKYKKKQKRNASIA